VDGPPVNVARDLVFISSTVFLASMQFAGQLVMVSVEGEFLGIFAHVSDMCGLLYFPDRRVVAVGSVSVGKVFFFNVDDFDVNLGVSLTESDALGVINTMSIGGIQCKPVYLSSGESTDELLVSTMDNKVLRVCVPGTPCKSQFRNAVMLTGYGTVWYGGVRAMPLDNSFLICDRKQPGEGHGIIYKCPLDATGQHINSCSIFADWHSLESTLYWDPHNLVMDHDKQIMYVADNDFSAVHVFTFDGDSLGNLEENPMFLSNPVALAIKPGALAAISPIEPPAAAIATAGVSIVTGMALRDRTNSPLPASSNMTNDLLRFHVSATGLNPEGFEITIRGVVTSASEANILIKYAGNWLISVMEGIKNPQHLLGSPYEITVEAAATAPAECEAEFDRVLIAGDEFSLEIITTDAFGNPTTGAEFSFSCCNGEAMTKAGEYMVHATPAIKGNPFRFDVLPAAASADRSEHNIKAGTELVSKKELVVDLRVFPKDAFNNTIAEAAGYAVRIDGGGEIALTAPDFEYEHVIEAGFEGSVEFVFTLNGEEIRGGGASIKVKKPEKEVLTKTNIYIGVFGFVLAVVIVLVLKMLLDENATSADVMTKGAEMASIAKSMGTNILDPVTDFTSWFLVIRKCGGWVSNVYLFFVMVAFVTTGQSVRTSAKQLNFLSKDNGGGKLATHQSRVELLRQVSMGRAEMDEVFVKLRKKHPEQNAVAKKAKGVLSMLKKEKGAVAPVLDPDPADETVEQKEKRLLGIFRKIAKMNRDIGQRERKEERVSGAVLQVFVEDIPGTVFNAMYMIYGCINLEEDEEGGAAAKMFVFLLATFLSVALGVKKFLEWRQIKADRRNVESWIEIVEHRLVDATKLLREIKGETGDLEQGDDVAKDAVIARLKRGNQALKEEARREAERQAKETGD